MDIQNGMIVNDLWNEILTISDEEYDEYLEHCDTLREEREGY